MQFSEALQTCSRLGRWLHQKNYLAAADGNFSLRELDFFWITERGIHKGFTEMSRLARVSLDGKTLDGNPSSEMLLHLRVYEKCPSARCVIHAHPPAAIAWSISHPDLNELPCDSFSEVILALGRIPIAPYARPGGEELARSIVPYLPSHRAIILGRHGALSWGEDFEEALNGIERMEHAAMVLALTMSIGGAKPLPPEEVDWLKRRRAEIGHRSL